MTLPHLKPRHWLLPVLAAVHVQLLLGVSGLLHKHATTEQSLVLTMISGLARVEPVRPPAQRLPEPKIEQTLVAAAEPVAVAIDLPETSTADRREPSPTAITVRTAAASAVSIPLESSGEPSDASREDFISVLATHLAHHKQYPVEARRRRITGIVTVHFRFGTDGMLQDCQVIESSGNRLLDAEALAMLRRAQPLPPIPPEIGTDSMSVNLPVEFSLTRG